MDVEPWTYAIDPKQLEGAITDRTKAIMPVILYGRPASMRAINELAECHGLAVTRAHHLWRLAVDLPRADVAREAGQDPVYR